MSVDVTKPHTNNFARVILGLDEWDVSVTATAIVRIDNTAVGAAPWIMNIDAFNGDGSPKYTSANPQNFGETNGDYPISGLDLAWTDFNGNNNVNTSEVRKIIDGSNVVTATIDIEPVHRPAQPGQSHRPLSGTVNHAPGRRQDVPIPITGPCPGRPIQRGLLQGLGDVPCHQRQRWQSEGHPRLLPE